MTNEKNEMIVKSLPSTPVFNDLVIDFGSWTANRQKQFELMALYQSNDIVHACIDLVCKAIVAANPGLFQTVNKGSKTLTSRGLKRLSAIRSKKINRQSTALNRKGIGDDEELAEVVSSDFLDALNSDIDGLCFHDLIRLIAVSVCVYGIGFLYKNRDNVGRVESYSYLPTYNVLPDRNGDGTIQGWFYSNLFGQVFNKEPLDSDDVIIFRWPSPTDPLASGDSPLMSVLAKLDLSQKFLQFQDWLLNNRARPDGVFIPKMPDGSTLTPDQATRQEKRINDKFRGPGNGRWAVAEQAGTYVPLTFSPTDLAPLQFNEELRKAVLFALNVPEGFTNNDGNRANLTASLEQFARQCLSPLVTMFEGVLNREAATYDPTLLVMFESVIPEDQAADLEAEKFELSKWVAGLQFGGLDNDEFRVNVLGLEPKADSDLYEDEPEPDPVPPPVQPPVAMPVPPPEKAVSDADADPTPGKSLDLLRLNREVSKGRLDRATAVNVVARAFDLDDHEAKRLVTFPTRKSVKALPKVTPGSSTKLADTIRRQMDQQEQHYVAQATGNKFFEADGVTVKSPDKFTSLDEWDEQDQYHYKPYLQVEMTKTANGQQQGLIRAGADPDAFAVVPDHISDAVDNASLDFAQSTNQTTLKNLNDALDLLRQDLKAGLENGDPVALLKKKVQAIFEDIDSDRADLIARTEISRASHEGQKIAAKASGIVKGFKLVTSPDCCDECEDLDGKEIGIDGKFNEGDDYSTTPVPVHPYCRCTMQSILDLGDDD